MGRHKEPLEKMLTLSKGDGKTLGGREIAVKSYTPHPPVVVTPLDLGERGETEWQKIWDAGFWLHPDKDYHWVEMIARSYDDIDTFRKRVQLDGLVVTGYNGQPAAHPLISEIRKAEKQIQTCLSVLGFSPKDRAALGIAEAKAKNALLELIERDKK